jgi:hypothetical protein
MVEIKLLQLASARCGMIALCQKLDIRVLKNSPAFYEQTRCSKEQSGMTELNKYLLLRQSAKIWDRRLLETCKYIEKSRYDAMRMHTEYNPA